MRKGDGNQQLAVPEAQLQPRAEPGHLAGCAHAPLGQGAIHRSVLAQLRAGRGGQGAVRARGAEGAGQPGAPALFNAHSQALSALLLLLLLLLTVPMEIYSFVWFHYRGVYDDLGCRASYSVHELCACATVLSVASLNAEHCLALCQRLLARHLLTLHRTAACCRFSGPPYLASPCPRPSSWGRSMSWRLRAGSPSLLGVRSSLVGRPGLQVFIQVRERGPDRLRFHR